ncbi:helix-turn-helix transcriptional regulator [Evtepia sp.]
MEIGKKLRQARTQAGLTQEQAAERILVSRQTVSNWETGGSQS